MTTARRALPRLWLVLVLASAASPFACQGEAPTSDEPADGGRDPRGGSAGQTATGGHSGAGLDASAATGGRPTSLTGGSADAEPGGRAGTGATGEGGGAGLADGRGGATGGGGGASSAGGRGGGTAGTSATAGRGGAPGGRGGTGPGGSGGTHTGPFTVFIAGDSTVQTYVNSAIHQGGWGQFLAAKLDTSVKVDNRAIGGRTSRRFIEEDRLRDLLSAAHPGDYLLVQFGTNDSNKTATYDDGEPYYLDPATAFRTWMQQYADGAASRGVRAIFVTPPPRNSCRDDGLSFNYSFTAYANAMKELGAAAQVPVVDLGKAAVDYLDAKKDCTWASKSFFLIRADGTVDGTHFQENGASILASLVAQGLALADPVLAAHLRP